MSHPPDPPGPSYGADVGNDCPITIEGPGRCFSNGRVDKAIRGKQGPPVMPEESLHYEAEKPLDLLEVDG